MGFVAVRALSLKIGPEPLRSGVIWEAHTGSQDEFTHSLCACLARPRRTPPRWPEDWTGWGGWDFSGADTGRPDLEHIPINGAHPDGLRFYPGQLDRAAQAALVETVLKAQERAPFYAPRLPRTGAPMSVRMTNLGPLGWVTDQAGGYRYQAAHPETGAPWPPIPPALLDLWADLAEYPAPPEACLVNLYRDGARMSLHVDADELARDAPVLSVSLGDTALFRVGGPKRSDPTRSFRLSSGDVVVLAGSSRRCFHGVDRVLAGSSRLVPDGGRINLTLRRVTLPVE